MKQYKDFNIPKPGSHNVLTLGAFDGLHKGHQAIIRRTVRAAHDLNSKSIVVSFEVPPRMVINPEKTEGTLLTNERKAMFLEDMSLDILIHTRLTKNMRAMEPEDFVHNCLMKLRPALIFTGPHVSFGKNRRGDHKLLKDMGRALGFKVIRVPALKDSRGRIISSTNIRKSLAGGRFKEAVAMLGRDYSLSGEVIRGLGYAGKEIGLATANINTGLKVLPPPGVYAVYVNHRNKLMPGILNIGRTVPPKVEVHVFGLAANLYGKNLTIWFKEKMRNEIVFKNMTHERETIAADVARVRRFFGIDQNRND